MIESLLPQIQKLITTDIINSLKKNGAKTVVKGLYTMMPGAVRVFIKEETFTAFCLSHQDKIFGNTPIKSEVKRSAKKTPASKTLMKKVATKKKK